MSIAVFKFVCSASVQRCAKGGLFSEGKGLHSETTKQFFFLHKGSLLSGDIKEKKTFQKTPNQKNTAFVQRDHFHRLQENVGNFSCFQKEGISESNPPGSMFFSVQMRPVCGELGGGVELYSATK